MAAKVHIETFLMLSSDGSLIATEYFIENCFLTLGESSFCRRQDVEMLKTVFCLISLNLFLTLQIHE